MPLRQLRNVPGLTWTVTVSFAVRPDMIGSVWDISSMFPPSWEAVMPTLTTGVGWGLDAMVVYSTNKEDPNPYLK